MSTDSILITGGSSGIGKATVYNALSQGWDVAVTYYKNEISIVQLAEFAKEHYPSQKFKAYQLDLKDFSRIELLGNEILTDFEKLSAIVCNAGIDNPGSAVLISNEHWQEVLDTNLTGHFYLIRFFLLQLMSNHYGRIVILSSLAADGSSGQIAYATSKGGLTALAKTIAKEYGHKGITANVIVPGLIETDFIKDGDSKDLQSYFTKTAPLKRLGTVDEVAKAIMFLVSKESSYINGAVLNITGGLDWVF